LHRTAGQLAWTTECEKGLTEVEKGDKGGLKLVKKKWIQMLNKYSEMVRGGLSKGDRGKLVAVITIEASTAVCFTALYSPANI
jgi:dynein heavy chain